MSIFKRKLGKDFFEVQKDEQQKQKDFYLHQEIDDLKKALATLQNDRLKNIKSPENKKETVAAIQLLILHYTGLLGNIQDFNFKNNDLKAEFLKVIFNTEGAENIRRRLSNVGGKGSSLLTLKNLKYLEGFFTKLELHEPLKRVKKDLATLNSK